MAGLSIYIEIAGRECAVRRALEGMPDGDVVIMDFDSFIETRMKVGSESYPRT